MPVLKTFKWVEKTASLAYQSPLLRQQQQQLQEQQQQLQEDELTRSGADFPVKLEAVKLEAASQYNPPNDPCGTPPTPGKQSGIN